MCTEKPLDDLDQKIIRHLASGLISKEIAPIVGCSKRTVDDRIYEMKKAWDCRTREQLVLKIIGTNMITMAGK